MNQEILDAVLIIVQIATLIALIIYVIKTWEIASASKKSTEISEEILREMKESRRDEVAPYVVVFFDIPYGTQTIHLVVKNVGKSVAENVRFKFQPPLRNSNGVEINNIPLIKQGIRLVPPGYEIRTIFDWAYPIFKESEIPKTYLVKVSYSGGLDSERRENEFIVDLSAFKDLIQSQKNPMGDLVRAVEKIERNLSDSSYRILKK